MWNTDIHSPCHLFSPLSLKFLTSSSEIRDVSQALFQQRFRYVLSSSMHSSKLAMNGDEPKKATLLYSPSSSSKQLLISLEWSVTSVFQKLVRAQSYQLSGTAPYLWKRVPRLATVSMGQATTLKYQCYLSFMDCFSPGSQKRGYFWLMRNKSRMNRRVAVVRDNCLIHLSLLAIYKTCLQNTDSSTSLSLSSPAACMRRRLIGINEIDHFPLD